MTLQKALPVCKATDGPVRVLRTAARGRVGIRRRSGWPTEVLHALALPSGIPPGRSRPEPAKRR